MNDNTRQSFIIRGTFFVLLAALSIPSVFLCSQNVFAEEKGLEKEKAKSEPISVSSNRMVSAQKENKIYFYGNVVAVRGDLTIRADQLEVYNGKDGKKTEKITATGNVEIESKSRNATGQKAVYYEVTERILLTGNPRAWEKNNEILGEEMIFLIKEDKFIVNGKADKGKQIKLTLFPKKDEKD